MQQCRSIAVQIAFVTSGSSARVMIASASTLSLFVESTRNQTRDNPTIGGWSPIGAAP
jgi:hypothetical protein